MSSEAGPVFDFSNSIFHKTYLFDFSATSGGGVIPYSTANQRLILPDEFANRTDAVVLFISGIAGDPSSTLALTFERFYGIPFWLRSVTVYLIFTGVIAAGQTASLTGNITISVLDSQGNTIASQIFPMSVGGLTANTYIIIEQTINIFATLVPVGGRLRILLNPTLTRTVGVGTVRVDFNSRNADGAKSFATIEMTPALTGNELETTGRIT